MTRILFYGDPHGVFGPLHRAVSEERPDVVLILGDLDTDDLLRDLEPVLASGAEVRFIHGNHDFDRAIWYDGLFANALAQDHYLQGRIDTLKGLRVAGLGGHFRSKVWMPPEAPRYARRADLLAATRKGDLWRDGLPLRIRGSIFAEDLVALQNAGQADILITHEAPTSHRHGHTVIDDLAKRLGVRLIVHGHIHENYDGVTRDGIPVRGVDAGTCWIWES